MMQMTMYFAYGLDKRPEVRAETTFEAVLNGERTSTLRQCRWYSAAGWQAVCGLKKGELVCFWSGRSVGEGRSVRVRLTRDARLLEGELGDAELEMISRQEGWSVGYLRSKGYHRPGGQVVQLQYEII